MRKGSRGPISPSMAVALTALVVALGGTAFAAGGGFAGGDGAIQGCVAQDNIVNSITDPALGALTHVITPKGALIVVAPGETCPQGTEPQKFAANQDAPASAALPAVMASHSTSAKSLGTGKSEVAGAMLPAGSYLVNATAVINDRGSSSVEQTIKCALVDAEGRTIPGTTVTATIPANSPNTRLTLPISAAVPDLPPGKLSIDCKNSLPLHAGTSARAADNTAPSSSGSVEATQTASTADSSCPAGRICFWDKFNYGGKKIMFRSPYEETGGGFCVDFPAGFAPRSAKSSLSSSRKVTDALAKFGAPYAVVTDSDKCGAGSHFLDHIDSGEADPGLNPPPGASFHDTPQDTGGGGEDG
ncbi:MAG: hypothetical protein QOE27_2763 [Solirubrobacteraceae bacterium]|nr:hypothetical protein [Solirubrobacteraceae bacterium]